MITHFPFQFKRVAALSRRCKFEASVKYWYVFLCRLRTVKSISLVPIDFITCLVIHDSQRQYYAFWRPKLVFEFQRGDSYLKVGSLGSLDEFFAESNFQNDNTIVVFRCALMNYHCQNLATFHFTAIPSFLVVGGLVKFRWSVWCHGSGLLF